MEQPRILQVTNVKVCPLLEVRRDMAGPIYGACLGERCQLMIPLGCSFSVGSQALSQVVHALVNILDVLGKGNGVPKP